MPYSHLQLLLDAQSHWHFVMWPEGDEDLGLFMQRLSVTHVTRWQKHRNVFG